MKNLIKYGLFAIFVTTSSVSFAEENNKKFNREERREEKFSTHKNRMISNLNEEKAAIEQVIGCVNSAQDHEAMEKCREIKQAAMEKIQERNRASKRENLQNELKKLDEEESNAKNKSSQR